jgi:hypothetical protein
MKEYVLKNKKNLLEYEFRVLLPRTVSLHSYSHRGRRVARRWRNTLPSQAGHAYPQFNLTKQEVRQGTVVGHAEAVRSYRHHTVPPYRRNHAQPATLPRFSRHCTLSQTCELHSTQSKQCK